jgi:heat-inducible transcriptional repressor
MEKGNRSILTPREMSILEEVVRNYILTASPTSSQCIAQKMKCRMSPATIRNVMGSLEEKGLLTHPHTSAGRMPTDKGYRYYVDGLVRLQELPDGVKQVIRSSLAAVPSSDIHLLMEATTKALSRTTNQLGVILSPRLHTSIFRHVHITEISPRRYCMHLTVDSGFVKSLSLELESDVSVLQLESACHIMNERCYGLPLGRLLKEGESPFSDVREYDLGVIRLFIPSIHRLAFTGEDGELYTEGEMNIVRQPEFMKRQQVGAIIDILEEKKLLFHMFEKVGLEPGHVSVSIGGEIDDGKFSSFSIVKTRYSIGRMEGSLGIIGPKRMEYPLLVAVVDYTAQTLSEMFSPSQ